MDKVALLPADDRAALFGETGARRGVADTIIEKDFWVCWSLRRLFGLAKGTTASLVFKGGTSLSKAFSAIRRFSEDINCHSIAPNSDTSVIAIPKKKGSAGSRRIG